MKAERPACTLCGKRIKTRAYRHEGLPSHYACKKTAAERSQYLTEQPTMATPTDPIPDATPEDRAIDLTHIVAKWKRWLDLQDDKDIQILGLAPFVMYATKSQVATILAAVERVAALEAALRETADLLRVYIGPINPDYATSVRAEKAKTIAADLLRKDTDHAD